MGLSGNFRNVQLGVILNALWSRGRRGTLILWLGNKEKRLSVTSRGISLTSGRTLSGFPLGSTLVRSGAITEHQLNRALEVQQSEGELLGRILVQLGYCDEVTVEEAARVQAAEELYDIFTWEDASFQFVDSIDEDLPCSEAPFATFFFDVDEAVAEAERRLVRWREFQRRMDGLQEVYTRTGEAAAPEDRDLAAAFWMLDGERSVAEIVYDSHLGVYETARLILTLLGEERIRPCTQMELLNTARHLVKQQKYEKAVVLLERAHRWDPTNTCVLEGLVGCLERLDRDKDAASYLVELGRALLMQGGREAAITQLEQAARKDLRSHQARVLLADEYLRMGRIDQAARHAQHAADLLIDKDDLEGAVKVLSPLVPELPDDLGLRTTLANVCTKTGRSRQALKHLLRVATLLERRGDNARLEDIYRRILQIDPEREDIERRLKLIETSAARKSRDSQTSLTMSLGSSGKKEGGKGRWRLTSPKRTWMEAPLKMKVLAVVCGVLLGITTVAVVMPDISYSDPVLRFARDQLERGNLEQARTKVLQVMREADPDTYTDAEELLKKIQVAIEEKKKRGGV